MKTCDHSVLYVLDFANQCIPLRPDGCLLCERDELQSKLDSRDKELAELARHADHLNTRIVALDDKLQALRPMVRAARSWHNFHHGSTIVQCDDICEALPAAEEALK